MTAGPANPFVFLVGCPRSGTTLLKRMVDAHPAIAVTPELQWIPRLYRKRVGMGPDDRVSGETVAALTAYRRFPRLGIPASTVDEIVERGAGTRYAELVRALFDLYGEAQGKPLVGEKTPGYVGELPLLHRLFPAARFVHIVRDGRDVCLSSLGWSRTYKNAGKLAGYDQDPIAITALWWKRWVGLGVEDGSELGSSLYHELRYESLVADPATECRSLCDFLGVPYDPAMLAYHQTRARREWDTGNRASLPPTPGLRDWRRQMAPADVQRFEAAAGDLLAALGYERAFAEVPPQARDGVERLRSGIRLPRLPRRW
ncbi:MAG TPA: sulfotransferase [Thermoanaerobaculia bacterium]|nr:sulfotransferase [Thermoanaerobaculia bacterium]